MKVYVVLNTVGDYIGEDKVFISKSKAEKLSEQYNAEYGEYVTYYVRELELDDWEFE